MDKSGGVLRLVRLASFGCGGGCGKCGEVFFSFVCRSGQDYYAQFPKSLGEVCSVLWDDLSVVRKAAFEDSPQNIRLVVQEIAEDGSFIE